MGRNKSKGPTKKNALILMTFILLVLSAFSPKLPLGILLCSVNWLDDLNLYLFHCPRLGCFSDLSAAAWRTMLVFSPNLFLTHFMIIFWIDYLKPGLQAQKWHCAQARRHWLGLSKEVHLLGLSKLSYELYTQPIFGKIVKKLLLGPSAKPSMKSKTNINFLNS